jgi:hypothetical protein
MPVSLSPSLPLGEEGPVVVGSRAYVERVGGISATSWAAQCMKWHHWLQAAEPFESLYLPLLLGRWQDD